MSTVISILIFLVIFGVLVVVHEGGHFLIARAGGIRVNEFMVGFGPKLLNKKKNGTLYSIRLLPFGGACVFDGMPGLEDEEDEEEAQPESAFTPDGGFVQEQMTKEEEAPGVPFKEAKVWGRIATVFAGPLFNFLLAFVASIIVTAFSVWDYPVVTGFSEDSPALAAGLAKGDRIISMDGERIYLSNEVRLKSKFNEGEAIRIVADRNGEEITAEFVPSWSEQDARYYMGITLGEYGEVKGAQILPYAFHNMGYYVKWTYKSLGLLVTGRLGMDALSGPVGMVQMVDETYEASSRYGMSAVLLSMTELLLLLSVNLAIVNLLPIPGLDGGRLLFLFIEVIRGKPIPPEKEGYVHIAGVIALVALMVFVLFKDIVRWVG
ncbi:MAG: site-2 protease family protein [Lachnospiraceae bacterium]|nr:site-2 protease family protein [Lachnospiraceae bacterium]